MRRTHRSLWLLAVFGLLAFIGRRHLREHHRLLRDHHEHSPGSITEGI